MIALDTTTRSLQIVLAGAKNTNDCPFIASYYDTPATPQIGPNVDHTTAGNTNGVTAVTIMPAPGMSPQYTRRLKSFNLNNADLAAITLSILYNDNGTTYALYKITLQTLEQLIYEEGYGFDAQDANGAYKSQAAATSSATSIAQASASMASSMASIALLGSSQASSLASGIVIASVNSVSSQASSLAAGIVIASVNSVSSQASSMAALVPASVSSAASLALIVSSNASLGSSAGWSTTLSKTKSSFSF